MSNYIITNIGTYTYSWVDKNLPSSGTWKLQISQNKFTTIFIEKDVNLSNGSEQIIFNEEGIYFLRLKNGTQITNYDSVFYITSSQNNISLTNDKWVIMTKGSELSEKYEFEVEPAGWDIEQQNLYRSFQRNLKGDLLTSLQTSKDRIVLDFSEQQYIGDYAKSILEYYFHSKQSFYLAKKFYDEIWGEYNRIWEVTFEDESLNLERMGVTLNFIEI